MEVTLDSYHGSCLSERHGFRLPAYPFGHCYDWPAMPQSLVVRADQVFESPKEHAMRRRLIGALTLVLAVATPAFAADTPVRPSAAPVDSDLATARARIDASDWTGATDVLQKAVAREPGNADYHNLLAY